MSIHKTIKWSFIISFLFVCVMAAVFFVINIDNGTGNESLNLQTRISRVILDPGHGGNDCGAVFGNVCEDEINYDIALRIFKKLKQKKIPVFITVRDRNFSHPSEKITCKKNEKLADGKKITLRNRIKLIKSLSKTGNNLIISIHVNSLPSFFKGYSIYYPPESKRKTNMLQTARYFSTELKEDGIKGLAFQYRNILIPLKAVRNRFYRFNFTPALFSATGKKSVIIIETGNIRNSLDRKNLSDPAYRKKFADSVVKAIIKLFDQN